MRLVHEAEEQLATRRSTMDRIEAQLLEKGKAHVQVDEGNPSAERHTSTFYKAAEAEPPSPSFLHHLAGYVELMRLVHEAEEQLSTRRYEMVQMETLLLAHDKTYTAQSKARTEWFASKIRKAVEAKCQGNCLPAPENRSTQTA